MSDVDSKSPSLDSCTAKFALSDLISSFSDLSSSVDRGNENIANLSKWSAMWFCKDLAGSMHKKHIGHARPACGETDSQALRKDSVDIALRSSACWPRIYSPNS